MSQKKLDGASLQHPVGRDTNEPLVFRSAANIKIILLLLYDFLIIFFGFIFTTITIFLRTKHSLGDILEEIML